MADKYIDYWEVGEYGGHFVEHAQALVGASTLVDMEEMRTMVAEAVGKVDAELEKCGVKRSSLRVGRDDITTAVAAARDDVRRFFHYLGSLDSSLSLDIEGFFPGNQLGKLSKLKPADVKARLDEIIRAFALPANSALPRRFEWHSTLTGDRDALDRALSSKGNARRLTRQGSAGLRQAREEFLRVYNGVAKPLTRGLLRSLGREHEFKLYFADLQVNETVQEPDDTAEAGPAELG